MSAWPTIHQHPLAYLIGLEGVALMRAFAGEHDRAFTEARLASVRRLLDRAQELGPGVDLEPMTTEAAYDTWAASYDGPGNSIFELEEAEILPILDGLPIGDAIDAACGTGRHAAHLVARGHRVRGFDTSTGMLAAARNKLPDVPFQRAPVTALPVPDDSADALVCALALSHLADLAPVFAEFARVLRPGGRLVVSDTRGQLLGSPLYPLVKWDDRTQSYGYLPNWRHATSEYLHAALPHSFRVLTCYESQRPMPMVAADDPEVPRKDPTEPPDIWELLAFAPDAANASYDGSTALIIWEFELEG